MNKDKILDEYKENSVSKKFEEDMDAENQFSVLMLSKLKDLDNSIITWLSQTLDTFEQEVREEERERMIDIVQGLRSALEALKNYGGGDEDGVMVLTSRQAIDEVYDTINNLEDLLTNQN